MRIRDMHRPGGFERAQGRQERITKRKQKDNELKAEQRKDEVRADFRAAKRVAGEGGLRKKTWGKA